MCGNGLPPARARPAFAPHTSLLPRTPASTALSGRRPLRTAPQPRRRRRPPCVTAVFLWSNNYDDEHSEDPDDADTEPNAEPDQPLDDQVWGDSWRRHKPGDISSLGDGGAGGGAFGKTTDAADDAGTGAVHPEDANRLYVALREHTSGPDDIDRLRTLATDSASDAFRRIVIGIFGTIPTDTYEVVISSDRGGVSRLMQSSLSTGYALRNAEFRMVLNESMGAGGDMTGREDKGGVHDLFTSEPEYMRSVARRGRTDASRLDGVVRWWDAEREAKQEMGGAEYVAKLEAENELLRERLAATQVHDANNNKLMDFMRTLSPEKIAGLQADVSSDAVDAFKLIIKNVLGELNPNKVQLTYSTGRDYMAQLAFWCLVVGYCIRNIEKRMEMTKVLGETEAFAEASLRDSEL